MERVSVLNGLSTRRGGDGSLGRGGAHYSNISQISCSTGGEGRSGGGIFGDVDPEARKGKRET